MSTLREVRRLLAGARPVLSGDAVRDLEEGALLAVQKQLSDARRDADLLMAATAAEVGRRSAPEFGAGGLSRKNGFNDPGKLIAAETGGSRRDANDLIEAGRRLAEAEDAERRRRKAEESGAPAPEEPEPAYREVAAALAGGRLSVPAASMITKMLDGVESTVPRERIQRVERQLVEKAHGLSVEQFAPIVRRYKGLLVENEAQARQRRLARERFVSLRELADGAVEISGRLDPVSAAPLRAALDGMVKDAFRRRRDGDPLEEDTRSRGQIAADALVTLARHFAGCDQAPSRASTQVVVRIDLEALKRGAGAGELDGSSDPISIDELRHMAVDAEYLPAVLGGASEVLNLGRGKRRFSPAQRHALLERDGGCAMCGAPPSYCEAHHIEWWDRDGGRSDLSNGVMLCVACHHTVHQQPWEIDASRDDVWFRPPASIDPERRPRLGGRARFGITARERAQALGDGPPVHEESRPFEAATRAPQAHEPPRGAHGRVAMDPHLQPTLL